MVTEANEQPYRKLATQDFENAEKLITLATAKMSEGKSKSESLSVADLLKQASKQNGGEKDDTKNFEYLSKHDPGMLNRIRIEEPEKYRELALAYAQR